MAVINPGAEDGEEESDLIAEFFSRSPTGSAFLGGSPFWQPLFLPPSTVMISSGGDYARQLAVLVDHR